MAKIKQCVLLLALLTSFFLISAEVQALGVSPALATLNFVPGESIKQNVCFRGSHTQYLNISVHGPQKDHIKISGDGLSKDNIMDLNKNSCLVYELTLPEKADVPGLNINDIYGTEMLQEVADGVGVKIQVSHQIRVTVPYPGKYLEIKGFSVTNSKAKEKVPIYLTVESKGKETIKDTFATIKIYDASRKLIWQTETDHINNINLDETKSISLIWDSKDHREGRYFAEVNVSYDNQIISADTPFKLGGLDVNLIGYTDTLELGGLKPFIADVDSIWAEPINNVHIIGEVRDGTIDNNLLTTFETVSRTLPPWGASSIGAYVDTDKIGLGDHAFKMTLYYDNTSKDYNGTLHIIKPVIIQPPEEPSKIFTKKNILIATILVLMIILILVLISIFFPKKKKQNQENSTSETKNSTVVDNKPKI